MDITDQFQEVRIFFADNGLVSVLEEMAAAFMALIEGNGVSGHETAHDLAEGCLSSAQKEVKMVRDQGPGIALGFGFFQDNGQAVEKRLAVFIVAEEFSSFDSPGHDVLEKAGGV